MKLSEKIIRLRKGRGLSQEELAERLGVSRQAVSRWESGTALPDAGNLRQISRLFEVSADYLLDEERESPEGPAAAVAQMPHRTNGKVIAGGCMAMMGFWGNVIIYIASRFVEVMIPRKVWSTDRSTWQYWWNSNVTGHSWKYFVQKYDLEWLVAALTVLLILGVVLLVRERKKKLR